jgi:hypothetical protein
MVCHPLSIPQPSLEVLNMRGPFRYALLAPLAALTLVAGCNEVPIEGLEKSLQIEVEKSSGEEAVKIDFLWVVDNSTSMCEEQIQLAANFEQFTATLSDLFKLDPRLAVVSHDMSCTLDSHGVQNAQGRFSEQPATGYPKSCQPKVIQQCSQDSECGDLDAALGSTETDGEWTCQKAQSESCEVNPNGSVNTECHRRCTTNLECQTVFGDPRYTCQKAGGTDDWSCLLPPKTDGCPESLGPVLDADELAQFPCLATIGVNQNKCFKYEQGLASAMAALDRSGANKSYLTSDSGSSAFLREDAYLVIIFVTDEDDCSADCGSPGDSWKKCPHPLCHKYTDENGDLRCKGVLVEDEYDTCALLGDQTEGGPLVPVTHYTNQIKSLKTDPSKVIVAAIAGDAVVPQGLASMKEKFERVFAGLTLTPNTCQKKCVDGDWSESFEKCVPDNAIDCDLGVWSLPAEGETKGVCSPDDGVIDTIVSGTTSFPRCADDVVDTPTGEQLGSVSACVGGQCSTEHDAQVQAETEAKILAILDPEEEVVLVSNPEQPNQGDEDRLTALIFPETCAVNCGDLGDCSFDSCVDCDEKPGESGIPCAEPTTAEIETLNEVFREVVREAYIHSKGSDYTCFQTTYVCQSESGRADWGSRYYELTKRFGPSGIFTNICDNAGIGPALKTIAEKIVNVVNRMCLPIHIFEYGKDCDSNSDCQSESCTDGICDHELEVLKVTRGDGEDVYTPLIESDSGEDGTYQIIPGGCLETGPNGEDVYQDAIVFGAPPEPGQYIEINYKGQPVTE